MSTAVALEGWLQSSFLLRSRRMYWFHATNRPDARSFLAIASDGCSPPPRATETKQLELQLHMAKPHVYCYLGRTLEQFGQFCVVLRVDGLPEGRMCPFDSGGLVRKILPVSGWEADRRHEYLSKLSFSTSTLTMQTSLYPGLQASSYLVCERPTHSGPHELWLGVPEADIWSQGTHWRAWTWEGRWLTLPVSDHLHAWSCSPALFRRIVDAAEQDTTTSPEVLDAFIRRYREGGVSALIADLRREQDR